MKLTPPVTKRLSKMAPKVVWWKSKEEALSNPKDLIARVMALGTWEDVQELEKIVKLRFLKIALKEAAPGVFQPDAWCYWHRHLQMRLSSLPRRKL